MSISNAQCINRLAEQIITRRHQLQLRGLSASNEIDQLYREFGRDTILRLPVSLFTHDVTQNVYSIIVTEMTGSAFWFSIKQREPVTGVRHSMHQPSVISHDGSRYYSILGCGLTIDEWLPLSALSPEEQLIYKLKYG